MRLALTFLAAACGLAAAAPASAQMRGGDDGFDDRGYDRGDRTPDWNYRRGESEAKGAYYDGGRYGPRGIGGSGGHRLDPWLGETDEGRGFVLRMFDSDRDGRIKGRGARRANIWFRRYADTDRDLRLTDPEIRMALVTLEKAAH